MGDEEASTTVLDPNQDLGGKMQRIPKAVRFAAAVVVAVSATVLVPSAAQAYPGDCYAHYGNSTGIGRFGAVCNAGYGSVRVVGFCENVLGTQTKTVYGPWVLVPAGNSAANCPGSYPWAYDVTYQVRNW
jgi:hypothetical protein